MLPLVTYLQKIIPVLPDRQPTGNSGAGIVMCLVCGHTATTAAFVMLHSGCLCSCCTAAATCFLVATPPLLCTQGVLHKLHLKKLASQRFTILDTMNSILYPGRFTLLLGPPGAGKSTLLNALAGRLHKSSSVTTTGEITYNGKGFDQFQAVHTAAYVDQNDLHQPELTVRETFNFAARCQGTGHKAGMQLLYCFACRV